MTVAELFHTKLCGVSRLKNKKQQQNKLWDAAAMGLGTRHTCIKTRLQEFHPVWFVELEIHCEAEASYADCVIRSKNNIRIKLNTDAQRNSGSV